MTEQQKQKVIAAYVDLEGYMQEYRTTLLWLTHGNHQATPRPTVKETQQLIMELKEKITAHLTEIQANI